MTVDGIYQSGQNLNGFTIQSVTPFDRSHLVAFELKHQQSGARLLHYYSDDEENLFSISLPTPPLDDSGLTHILEHLVMCGSGQYPTKISQIDANIATITNAGIGPDSSCYLFAGPAKQDLFNLAEIYMDAVFHPLLSPEAFQSEGHHLALDRDGRLTISGVVYNEMKGIYSNPEQRLKRTVKRHLLPDTVHRLEAGGLPEAIPSLTYAALKAYHQRYYHPANAYFFLYGNIPLAEWTAFLAKRLHPFQKRRIAVPLPRQTRWQQPQTVVDTYPAAEDDRLRSQSYLSLHWLVGDAADAETMLLFEMLDRLLLGSEAAPLRQALINSGLGSDLVLFNSDSPTQELTFGVGLREAEPEGAGAFVQVVNDTLTAAAETGFDPADIETAFRQIAQEYLEIRPFYPVHLLSSVLKTWLYGADPLMSLRTGDHVAALRRRLEADPALLGGLIRRRLLENPHRLAFIFRPSHDMWLQQKRDHDRRLEAARSRLTAAQMAQLETAANADRPDEPFDLLQIPAVLPQLTIKELPDRPADIPTIVTGKALPCLYNQLFTNGIGHLALAFDLAGLPPDLWPYLPVFKEVVLKLGAGGLTYEQTARQLSAVTHTLNSHITLESHAAQVGRSVRCLWFTWHSLEPLLPASLDIIHDCLFAFNAQDKNHLHHVLAQLYTRCRSNILYDGLNTALCHAARRLNPEKHLAEIVHGLPQLTLTRQLNEQFEAAVNDLLDKLERIRTFLLEPGRLSASFSGSDPAFQAVETAFAGWSNQMSAQPTPQTPPLALPSNTPPREGLAAPIQVAYCVQAMAAPHRTHPDSALLALGTHLVRRDYFLREIRFRGKAYGARAEYDPLGQTLHLASYRDPHIVRTLKVFAGAVPYIRQAAWKQQDVDRAAMTAVKSALRPLRPAEATYEALHRHLCGLTLDQRRQRYDQLKQGTVSEVKRVLLSQFSANQQQGGICVAANREALQQANHRLPDYPLEIHEL